MQLKRLITIILQGGFRMLKEIICDKFKQKRVEFHRGLNVVLGMTKEVIRLESLHFNDYRLCIWWKRLHN